MAFKSCSVAILVLVVALPAAVSAQTRALTLQEGVTRELNVMLSSPRFRDELTRARKQYPTLVAGFGLLAVRGGFGPAAFTPVNPPPVVLPETVCRLVPLVCRCRNGDRNACIDMIKEPGDIGSPGIKPGDILIKVPTCPQLVQQYQSTLNAIAALLAQAPLTSAQMQELARLQAEAEALYRRVVERGCLTR